MQTAVPSLSDTGPFSLQYLGSSWLSSFSKDTFLLKRTRKHSRSQECFFKRRFCLGSRLLLLRMILDLSLDWGRRHQACHVFPGVSIWALLSLYMPNQLLWWCFAPPSCPRLLKTSVVRAVEEGKWQVEVWAQAAAFPLYTAWFSHRMNWTQLCRTQALGSPCTPQGKLTSLLAKCCLMLV